MALNQRKAVFLDKDGTLVRDIPYNVDPRRVKLETGACEALRLLHARGYLLIVVSNQSGIARGFFPEKALLGVRRKLIDIFSRSGVPLAGFYYCPHHPEGIVPGYRTRCFCRKPHPGMLLRAAKDLQVELRLSWMVGDILDDVEAGKIAGCRTILIDNGNETQWEFSQTRTPDHYAPTLAQAARMIVSVPFRITERAPADQFSQGGRP